MIVDGCWVLLGSANWDSRSLRLNFEYNLECYDEDLAQRADKLAEMKRKSGRQVTLAELRENRLLRKIKFMKNTRLTICPLTDEEYAEILRMAGVVASPGIPLP